MGTQYLHERRKAAGLTQREVALRLGVSQETYGRTERGERALRGDEAERLARIFGCKPHALSQPVDGGVSSRPPREASGRRLIDPGFRLLPFRAGAGS